MEGRALSIIGSFVLLFVFLPVVIFAQDGLNVIPKPLIIREETGVFTYADQTVVSASLDFIAVTALLHEHPYIHFDEVNKVKSVKKIPHTGIVVLKAEDADQLSPNAYRLEVNAERIMIKAHNEQGVRYAFATLHQIMYTQRDGKLLPCLFIEDEPRFDYRGIMLDVSRHFFSIDLIKKYIDVLSLYKFNALHLHLNDEGGWRLQIKKYPMLTDKGSWRNYRYWREWKSNGGIYVQMGDANAYGGYYTQEEARDLVQYAASKNISVIPEINFDGNRAEVLAAYPEFACATDTNENNQLCIANNDALAFMKGVMDEVMEIFPSYIHVGGDQHHHDLANELEKYIKEKDRKSLKWGDLADNKMMYVNFNSYQSNPRGQQEVMEGLLPIDKVYQDDSLLKDSDEGLLGVQANVWTKYIPSDSRMDYMVFPRALALAELGWTNGKGLNWDDFEKRLQQHYLLMQKMGIEYYPPSYDVAISSSFNFEKRRSTISIKKEQYDGTIHYTIDGSTPDAKSPQYTEPFYLVNSALVKAAVFKDTIRYGSVQDYQVDIHQAIGVKVLYNNTWDEELPAQKEYTLVNGEYGSLSYTDGQWQGFKGDFDVILDFERRMELNKIKIRFMEIKDDGVFLPANVRLMASDDGKHFREMQRVDNNDPVSEEVLSFKTFKFDLKGRLARYIKIVAKNNNGRLLTDEVIVY